MRRHPCCLRYTFLPVGFALLACAIPRLPAASPEVEVKEAITKALHRLEQGVANYPKHRQCFSCHHQGMAMLALTAAQKRGFPVDRELLGKVTDFSLRTFRNKGLIAKGQGVGGDSVGVVYALHAFAAVERPYDDTTAALVQYLLVKQRKDGAWPLPTGGNRPPTMGSLFTQTGMAMFALKHYSPPGDRPGNEALQAKIDLARSKGQAWLLANEPVDTEDRVFHLHGLVDAEVEQKEIEKAREQLMRTQSDDGSWAQQSRMNGDAYATATALTALRAAGLPATDAAYQKGTAYLLKTQREDGAWVVQTRSRPLQLFFDNGDPGGKSQFLSFATTGWAVLALLELVPPR